MEFPVFVASDVHGEKVNFAIRFDPRISTLHQLLSAASRGFDALAEFSHQRFPEPFSVAYILSDVECQWHVLHDRAQLSPCCQVYVFRDQRSEVVATIPEPLELSGLLALRTGKQDCVSSKYRTPSPEPPRVEAFAPLSPTRLFPTRWSLPQSGRSSLMTRHRPTAPSSPRADADRLLYAKVTTRKDKTISTERFTERGAELEFANEVISRHFSRSHRFRLPILSPEAETQPFLEDAAPSVANMSLRSSVFSALQPQVAYVTLRESRRSDSSTPISSTVLRAGAPVAPQRWYDPLQRDFPITSASARKPATLLHHSHSALAHSGHGSIPYDFKSAQSKLLLPTHNTDADIRKHPKPCNSSGGSIIREERERLASQLQLGLDALRTRLQEEVSQFKLDMERPSTLQHTSG